MIVAGVFLKANMIRITTLSGNRSAHTVVAGRFNKLELIKNPSKENVKTFVMAFNAFCSDHAIEKIVLNRRATSGQGAGGAGTFVIEGILLAASSTPIEFAHAATIAATDRRELNLKSQRPETVDLKKAYDLAFEGLS